MTKPFGRIRSGWPHYLGLAAILILGGGFRFSGLSHGWSDFSLHEEQRPRAGGTFYRFHPDETTLVEAARQLTDSLHPPTTAYGAVPQYLLRLAAWGIYPAALNTRVPLSPSGEHSLVILARSLSAIASWLVLPLVYLTGTLVYSRSTGLLATTLTATAPIAIQQAHFYTVDSVFLMLTMGATVAILTSVRLPSVGWSALSGLLIGAAAGTRMVGLLLLFSALIGELARTSGSMGSRCRKTILGVRLWIVAGLAVGVLFTLQPYLLLDPQSFFHGTSHGDFAGAIEIAEGKRLRIWTLDYLHTTPYLYHWTNLWPAGVGWPLTVAFVVGIALAVIRPTWGMVVILVWSGSYFCVIGGLHAKPIRYILPLLPHLCVLAANAGRRGWQLPSSFRHVLRVAVVAIVAWSMAYGAAFSRIYTSQDARIQAARWIADNIPTGKRIGVETGAFGMGKLVSPERHSRRDLNLGVLYAARGYTLCGSVVTYVQGRLQDVDYLAVVDANRHQQFVAAADLLPGAASFYRRLYSGRQGFDKVREFEVIPRLGPLEFASPAVEHSFSGFDHPRVIIFKRRDPADFDSDLQDWIEAIAADARCPDTNAQRVAAVMRSGTRQAAGDSLALLRGRYPHLALADIMARSLVCEEGCQDVTWDNLPEEHPWTVGLSLAGLGLGSLAVDVLSSIALRPSRDSEESANGYVLVANRMSQLAQVKQARRVYELANEIHRSKVPLNSLGHLAFRSGQYSQACRYWEQSLELDDKQAGIHANLGQTAGLHLRDVARALHHLRRAVQLDPELSRTLDLSGWIRDLERAPAP